MQNNLDDSAILTDKNLIFFLQKSIHPTFYYL